MRLLPCFLLLCLCLLLPGCAAKKIKDVSYLSDGGIATPRLNIFVPRSAKTKQLPVLIFIHGGNWNSGNKNTYGFFGRNFAKKGVITVIPDYTLSPDANYDAMARQVAMVVQWTKANIAQYGGDPDNIFITGHSAGGHLAALAVMNPKYGIGPKAVAGIILNDAAGLDMQHYLETHPPTNDQDYLKTWGADPAQWHDASPIYFLNAGTPPLLIYVGDKTYASIKVANARFIAALQPYQPVAPITINKAHIPMVLQYFWPWSDRFDEVATFMKLHTNNSR